MNTYKLNRARYLAVPGGSIRIPACLCLHSALRPEMIERIETHDGVRWFVYRSCPIHGVQAIEPVLTAEIAQRMQKETAVVQTAVEVRN